MQDAKAGNHTIRVIPLLGREGVIFHTENVHFDARRDERDNGPLVLGNARRRVKSDRVPDVLDISLADPMPAKEAGGRIGAVHFETLVWAGVGRLKAHVVKDGADIEQFGIDLEPLALAGQRPEQEHPIGGMREQVVSDGIRTMLLVDGPTVDDTAQSEHGRRPFSILRMSKLFRR